MDQAWDVICAAEFYNGKIGGLFGTPDSDLCYLDLNPLTTLLSKNLIKATQWATLKQAAEMLQELGWMSMSLRWWDSPGNGKKTQKKQYGSAALYLQKAGFNPCKPQSAFHIPAQRSSKKQKKKTGSKRKTGADMICRDRFCDVQSRMRS